MGAIVSQSPASRLFTQSFIQTQIKENTKAPRHWPSCGEFTVDRWIPRTYGQQRGKCFHLMMSSCRSVVTCPFKCRMKLLIHFQSNGWSLGMDKNFHPTLHNVCNYLSVVGLKLNHIRRRGPSCLNLIVDGQRNTSQKIDFASSPLHYSDVIMTTMASQITSLAIVYSTVYSADQRKNQSSASLAFVWGMLRDRRIPRTKGQWRGKCFHLMT